MVDRATLPRGRGQAGGPDGADGAQRIVGEAGPANDTYVVGETLSFTVTFDENVTVTGTGSTLGLTIGATARTAAYASKTANSITYTYTVQAGDNDADGIVVNGISLNGGTIRDGAGNNANLSLTGLRHIQYSNRIGWALQASRTIPLSSSADLALDVQAPNTLGRGVIRDVLIGGSGAPTGSRYQVGQSDNMSLQASANLRWRPTADDAVNVNFQYIPIWNSSESVQFEAAPNGALRSALGGITEYDNNYSVELGGDWERELSDALTVKLIALVSNTSVDQSDTFDILTAPATSCSSRARRRRSASRALSASSARVASRSALTRARSSRASAVLRA